METSFTISKFWKSEFEHFCWHFCDCLGIPDQEHVGWKGRLWVGLTLCIDEWMDPQGSSKAEFLQTPHHSPWVGKLLRIKLGVSVTDLPVIVNLQLTVVKAVLYNIPGKVEYDGLVDVCLILRPAGPDRVGQHLKHLSSLGLASVNCYLLVRNVCWKVPESPRHVLEHWLGVSSGTESVGEVESVSPHHVRLTVLGGEAEIPAVLLIPAVEERLLSQTAIWTFTDLQFICFYVAAAIWVILIPKLSNLGLLKFQF